MAERDLAWLMRLLEECGDQDATVDVDLTGDVGHTPFDDLGFDSLALFNTTSRIEREHGITLPLDTVLAAETPAGLLKLVNERVASGA